MSKNGYQPTIPALLKRKRRIDNIKEEEAQNRSELEDEYSHSSYKRRSLGPSHTDSEAIILDTPERLQRPETPDEESPQKEVNRLAEVTFSQFRELSCSSQPSPLPLLKWAESNLLWNSLLKKDIASSKNRGDDMFKRNPQVQPRMRSILLDWLIEVSDVYKLHRETYYLAQDYVDRVLLLRKDTPKQDLQLLGITCLFLAAKVEEIYPPKVAEFAYVTDGACTETAILEHEMSVLMALEWDVCSLTPAGWLRFYLQLACQQKLASRAGEDFELPRFPSSALPLVSKLLDLATLDSGCVNFRYSVLAAAALALVYGRPLATATSGIEWRVLKPCVAWMAPFAVALSSGSSNSSSNSGKEESTLDSINEEIRLRPELRPSPTVSTEDAHNLQCHSVSMEMLEVAQSILSESAAVAEDTSSNPEVIPQTPCSKPKQHHIEETPEGLLTPPASKGRCKSKVTDKPGSNVGLRPTELFIPLTPNT